MYQPYSQPPAGYPQQQQPPIGAGAAYPAAQPYGQQPFQPQQQAPPSMPPSDRESYQSVLPPSVTPGWNDPPSVLPTGHTPNRLTAMRRRPVDPSISGSGSPSMGYGAAPMAQNQGQYGSPYNQQAPQQQQQQQQYQAYGQQPQQAQYPGAAPYQQQQQHY